MPLLLTTTDVVLFEPPQPIYNVQESLAFFSRIDVVKEHTLSTLA